MSTAISIKHRILATFNIKKNQSERLKKAHVINKNIDGFYAKTTQEDSGRFV
jgi:hypothetical protein